MPLEVQRKASVLLAALTPYPTTTEPFALTPVAWLPLPPGRYPRPWKSSARASVGAIVCESELAQDAGQCRLHFWKWNAVHESPRNLYQAI